MNTNAHIESTIVAFLTGKLKLIDEGSLSRDANLLVDGTLDSVSVMRLIAHIESALGFRIPPKDLVPKNFMTIDAMVTYLSAKVTETST